MGTTVLSPEAERAKLAAPRRYASTIDLIRFLACSLLAIGHLATESAIGTQAHLFLRSGIVSTIFFTLSGFIVCQTSSFWRDSWREIATQRFARLYPAHLFAVVLALPPLLMGVDRYPVEAVLRETAWWVICLQVFHWSAPGSLTPLINGPAWSVTPLLFGGMALPAIRALGLGNWQPRRLWWVLAGLLGARLAPVLWQPFSADVLVLTAYHIEPFSHVLEIFAGGVTAMLVRNCPRGRFWRFLERDRALGWATVLVVVPLALAVRLGGRAGAFYAVHGPMVPVCLLFLVAAYANREAMEGFCRAAWVKTAGEMSLFIFLFHFPVGELVDRALLRLHFPVAVQASWGRDLLILGATAALSYLALPAARLAREWVARLLRPRAAVAEKESSPELAARDLSSLHRATYSEVGAWAGNTVSTRE